jgi:nitroimidazol reductase NimA-like FMN-containing flavoprotein (pyridoxamine 5'-phosphate oxidase superfamily)
MDNGHFTRLSGDECRHLVRGHSVGRVCWLSDEGLQALPVSYVASDDLIYFRVDRGSVLGELSGPVQVAFEVDDIDVPTATGWSVLVRGEAAASDADGVELLPPWAPGHLSLTVAVTPQAYSGRVVSADDPRS